MQAESSALEFEEFTETRPESLTQIAKLHMQSLPQSLLSLLGEDVVCAYYRFAAASDEESVFISRSDASIVGAAVLSKEPQTLMGRFFRAHFALILKRMVGVCLKSISMVLRLLRMPLGGEGNASLKDLPEVVQIFVQQQMRGQGVGQRLLGLVEQVLHESESPAYFVKTLAEAQNPALDFYSRQDFKSVGEQSNQGVAYVYLVKHLRKD